MPSLFDAPEVPQIAVAGEERTFPVRRIFCVGRNYADHAREMGAEPTRDKPIWFTKSALAFCPSDATIPYPPGTGNCHYEMELVVAIGAPGFRVATERAMDLLFGYACGLDLTRRDLQNAAKDRGHPWDTGKDFENAAVIAPLTRAETVGAIGQQRITLSQNGGTRQDAVLSDMLWSVPELIADLSGMYHLQPGDLIFTGTPAGVGPIAPGDAIHGMIDGLEPLELRIAGAE